MGSIDCQETAKGAWEGRTRASRRAYVEDYESNADEPSEGTVDLDDSSEDDIADEHEDMQSMEEPDTEELNPWDWIGAEFEARAMEIGTSKPPHFSEQY